MKLARSHWGSRPADPGWGIFGKGTDSCQDHLAKELPFRVLAASAPGSWSKESTLRSWSAAPIDKTSIWLEKPSLFPELLETTLPFPEDRPCPLLDPVDFKVTCPLCPSPQKQANRRIVAEPTKGSQPSANDLWPPQEEGALTFHTNWEQAGKLGREPAKKQIWRRIINTRFWQFYWKISTVHWSMIRAVHESGVFLYKNIWYLLQNYINKVFLKSLTSTNIIYQKTH